MPIDRNIFEFANDPSSAIKEFLSKEPDKAFTLREIYENIETLGELSIPIQKIKDTLDQLIRNRDVKVAWVKGDGYYIIDKTYFYL